MPFSRARRPLDRLRRGLIDSGAFTLERTRDSDLYRGESGTYRGLRARRGREVMLAGVTVGSTPPVEYLFAFSDDTDWSDGTQWTDTP